MRENGPKKKRTRDKTSGDDRPLYGGFLERKAFFRFLFLSSLFLVRFGFKKTKGKGETGYALLLDTSFSSDSTKSFSLSGATKHNDHLSALGKASGRSSFLSLFRQFLNGFSTELSKREENSLNWKQPAPRLIPPSYPACRRREQSVDSQSHIHTSVSHVSSRTGANRQDSYDRRNPLYLLFFVCINSLPSY